MTTQAISEQRVLVWELYEFEPQGLVADLVNNAFARVDWMELMENV